MSTEQITDHVEQAQARLTQQFRDKAKVLALVEILVEPVQEIESVLWALYTERTLAGAIGAQLDVLGRLVGQGRGALDDDDFRRYIGARIVANRSNATIDTLLDIADRILSSVSPTLVLEDHWPASLVLRVGDFELDEDLANDAIDFLRAGRAAGVRLLLESNTDDDETLLFAFDGGGVGAGYSSVTNPSLGGKLITVREAPRFYTTPDSGYVGTSAGTSTALAVSTASAISVGHSAGLAGGTAVSI